MRGALSGLAESAGRQKSAKSENFVPPSVRRFAVTGPTSGLEIFRQMIRRIPQIQAA